MFCLVGEWFGGVIGNLGGFGGGEGGVLDVGYLIRI